MIFRYIRSYLVLFLLCCFSFFVYPSNYVDIINTDDNSILGRIDYSTITLYTDSTSSWDDVETYTRDVQVVLQDRAEIYAQNKLYYMFTSLVFDADNKILDIVNQYPDLNERVLDIIKQPSLLGVSYPKRDSVKVDMSLPLYKKGGISIFEIFYDYTFKYNPKPMLTYFSASKNFDGLIIDARNLDINPAVFPSVYDEDGNLIYNVSFVTEEAINERGFLRYVYSPNDINDDFEAPYSLVAWGIRGHNKCDIVISNDDARLIASNEGLQNAIKNSKIYVIIGDVPPIDSFK